jgi:hypothetical protein
MALHSQLHCPQPNTSRRNRDSVPLYMFQSEHYFWFQQLA